MSVWDTIKKNAGRDPSDIWGDVKKGATKRAKKSSLYKKGAAAVSKGKSLVPQGKSAASTAGDYVRGAQAVAGQLYSGLYGGEEQQPAPAEAAAPEASETETAAEETHEAVAGE
jgi:hypothetical protein